MQTQTQRPAGRPRPDSRFRLVWNRLRQHPFMKLIALLLAVFFWVVVLASDPSLMLEKEFTATVSVTGADTLRSRGYVVMDDLTANPISVEMKTQVSQSNYDRATAASFSPRLDLTQITGEGKQEVFFSTTYNTYGEVLSITPASVEVTVERYITRSRVPVAVRKTGDAPAGLWHGSPACDPSAVAVSGPASLVEQVRRAVVELPLESLDASLETNSLTGVLTLETADGDAIRSPLIRITSESITLDSARVDCQVLPTREVAVDVPSAVTGTPAHGYVVSEVRVSPETVTVADSAETLDALDALFVQNAVSVSNATDNLLVTVPLQGVSALAYASAREATVSVTVVPAVHTHTYADLPVTVENLAEDLSARLSRSALGAVLSGAYQDVEALQAEDIHLYVDATGLGAGVHSARVQCRVDGIAAYDFAPQQQSVTLTLAQEDSVSP